MILGSGSARSELMRRRSQHQHSSPAPAAPSPAGATPERLRWRKEQTAAQWRLEDRPAGVRGELAEPVDPAAERCLAAEASMVVLDALETVIQVGREGVRDVLSDGYRREREIALLMLGKSCKSG